MPHLTKRIINALAPREKAYIYGDDTPKNFGVRVYPSGHKAYVITYRPVPATRTTPKKSIPWVPVTCWRLIKPVTWPGNGWWRSARALIP